MIQKLNAEGRLEKKEAKKGIGFDKVRMVLQHHCSCFTEKLEFDCMEGLIIWMMKVVWDSHSYWTSPLAF